MSRVTFARPVFATLARYDSEVDGLLLVETPGKFGRESLVGKRVDLFISGKMLGRSAGLAKSAICRDSLVPKGEGEREG